ncbi:MAG: aldo/keto reductase [Fervidicoccaceae archaeon]
MRYRKLGSTGLEVSEISYGVYSLTGLYGDVDLEKAVRILRKALDLGINLFDTADVYGMGYGESILQKAFGSDVKDIIIATKIGYDIYSSGEKHLRRYDPEYLLFAARNSCERIGKKPIDIIQIHNPPLEALRNPELYKAMTRLVEEGLALHVGVALGPERDVLGEALEALSHKEVEVIQFIYNALEQRPGKEIATIASEKNVGILVRVPHAGGILGGRLARAHVERLRDHRSLRSRDWFEKAFQLYELMKPYLLVDGFTDAQNAIRFIFSSIQASSVIVIATSEEELEEYVRISDKKPMDRSIVAKIEELYREAEKRWGKI